MFNLLHQHIFKQKKVNYKYYLFIYFCFALQNGLKIVACV